MPIARDLRRLRRKAVGRLLRLRLIATQSCVTNAPIQEREPGVTYTVIELYNLWYTFSRSLFLSASFGALDGTGKRVALSAGRRPGSLQEALTPAVRLNPRSKNRQPPWTWWDEPRWVRTDVLLGALAAVGASNRPKVGAALSAPTKVFDELSPFRHFYAHRGRDTAAQLAPLIRARAIPSYLRPTEALLVPAASLGTTRPQPLLLDWIDDVTNAVLLSV